MKVARSNITLVHICIYMYAYLHACIMSKIGKQFHLAVKWLCKGKPQSWHVSNVCMCACVSSLHTPICKCFWPLNKPLNSLFFSQDLVKSHLMYAVREEVEVLKEQIKELIEKNNQLEYENSILKAAASQETISSLSQPRPQQPSSSSWWMCKNDVRRYVRCYVPD